MSGIISAPAFNNVFTETRENPSMQGFVTAIYEIGCLAGAMTILAFGDLLGRRKAMIIGPLTMILGVIIQVTAQPNSNPLAQFIIGRVIMGVGNGINTSTIPTYQGSYSFKSLSETQRETLTCEILTLHSNADIPQAECSKTSNRGLLICIEGGVIAFGSCVAYWVDYGASFGPPDLVWRFPISFQIIFALIVAIPMIFLPVSCLRVYLVRKEK